MSAGPEAIHQALTSGNLGTIRTLKHDVNTAMTHLQDAIEDIRLAGTTPTWQGSEARQVFNVNAWTTRATCEMCYLALNRAKLSLKAVAQTYEWVLEESGKQIEWWREAKKNTDSAVILWLQRSFVIGALRSIESDYNDVLGDATDFVTFLEDGMTPEQIEWYRNGLLRTMERDLGDPSRPIGPIIPDTFAGGNDDDDWIPQGLAYDPDTGLIQTAYNEDGTRAGLSIVDPETGELIQTVELAGLPGDTQPDHAGGVFVDGGNVYVTSSDNPPRLFTYPLDEIRNAVPGQPVAPSGDPQTIAAGAYATVHDGVMYAGTFTDDPSEQGELYTYVKDGHGAWVRSGGPYPTPGEAQGVAIKDGHIVFSTSEGRNNASTLQVYDLQTLLKDKELGGLQGWEGLPNMSEGVVPLPGGLLTTHESGAGKYVDANGNPVGDLWGGTHFSFTPYDDVGIDGDEALVVEPSTLREARALFLTVQSRLDTCVTQIGSLVLPASSLGEVSRASSYSGTLLHHFDDTSEWLDEGRTTADLTAAGLAGTADDYEETDQKTGDWFRKLEDRLSGDG